MKYVQHDETGKITAVVIATAAPPHPLQIAVPLDTDTDGKFVLGGELVDLPEAPIADSPP